MMSEQIAVRNQRLLGEMITEKGIVWTARAVKTGHELLSTNIDQTQYVTNIQMDKPTE